MSSEKDSNKDKELISHKLDDLTIEPQTASDQKAHADDLGEKKEEKEDVAKSFINQLKQGGKNGDQHLDKNEEKDSNQSTKPLYIGKTNE